jgi:hypothetical protein
VIGRAEGIGICYDGQWAGDFWCRRSRNDAAKKSREQKGTSCNIRVRRDPEPHGLGLSRKPSVDWSDYKT